MSVRLITLADEAYIPYLKHFLASARVNFCSAKPYIVLVNVPQSVSSTLVGFHPDAEFHFEKVDFESDMQKRCYCTNRRATLLYQLYEESNDALIWLDADSLIRKRCDDLAKRFTLFDFAAKRKCLDDLVNKKRVKPPTGFMGGLIMVNKTEAAKAFLKTYVSLMEEYDWRKIPKEVKWRKVSKLPPLVKAIWMANQNKLYSAYVANQTKLKFMPLSNAFLDTSLKDSSLIWSVKASTRGSVKFKQEQRKYV